MILNSISLRNYRNHKSVDLFFEKGLNFIVGDNAQGKTNIVEAIHFLSLGRSFRTNEDFNLINDQSDTAYVIANITFGDLKKKISVSLSPSGKKVLYNNKVVKKLSELNDIINVIIFEPPTTMLFKTSPKTRRDFLDINLSKIDENYLKSLFSYEKILKERNNLLKNEDVNLDQLEIITDMLIDAAEKIVVSRTNYIYEINKVFPKVVSTINKTKENVSINYFPFVKADEDYKINAKTAFSKALESDLKKKVTSIGPHREDFKISLNNKDVAKYGSQGENRLLALSLTLCPYFLIKEKDKKPIIVLDDVMSELDDENKERLISFLTNFEQVFITSTSLQSKGVNTYEIKNNKILRRIS
ncbi:MAG: DNA replication/repair protein RecF [Bacilli bacterium]|jgi:DNA replication and repair protein RecF